MLLGVRALVPVLTGFCCFAADDGDLLSRIRDHMRDYVARSAAIAATIASSEPSAANLVGAVTNG